MTRLHLASPHKRIGPALRADCCRRSVPREDGDLISERIKLLLDPLKQQIAITPRQVPAAHSAGEQNIPANEEFIFARKEAEAPRAMAGHFQHLQLESEKILGWCGRNQEVGIDRLDFQFKPKAAKELRVRNHRRRIRVAPEPTAEPPFDLRQIRNVVEMSMGKEEQFRRYAL